MPKRYFVTRHAGAVKWAVRHGLRARKVEMYNFDVATVLPGDVVMGTLPVHLIAEVNQRGAHYWHLTMDVPASMRGQELTADDMDACGARLDEFRVVDMGSRTDVIGTPDSWGATDNRPVLHLCIATGQALPNVMPILHEDWDRVVIFASPAMADQAKRLVDIVQAETDQRGLTGEPLVVKLPEQTSYPAIRDSVLKEMVKLRKAFPEHRLVLNITGGQKLMTLGFADALRAQARISYCNTDRGVIETVDPAGVPDELLPEDLLDLQTYMRMQGFRITRRNRLDDDELLAGLKAREMLTATLVLKMPAIDPWVRAKTAGARDGDGWKSYGFAATLHSLAANASDSVRAGPGQRHKPFQAEHRAEFCDQTHLNDAGRELLVQLISAGLLEPASGATPAGLRLIFPNVFAASYLAGGYVEEFALLSAAAVGLPPSHFAGNVGIDLQRARSGRSTKELNELDLALVWRNRLLIIECKAGRALMNKTQDILNKSALLLNAVGGLYGSAWVLSTGDLPKSKEGDVLDRAQVNRTTILDGTGRLGDLPQRIAAWAGLPLPSSFKPWDSLLVGGPPPAAAKTGPARAGQGSRRPKASA